MLTPTTSTPLFFAGLRLNLKHFRGILRFTKYAEIMIEQTEHWYIVTEMKETGSSEQHVIIATCSEIGLPCLMLIMLLCFIG